MSIKAYFDSVPVKDLFTKYEDLDARVEAYFNSINKGVPFRNYRQTAGAAYRNPLTEVFNTEKVKKQTNMSRAGLCAFVKAVKKRVDPLAFYKPDPEYTPEPDNELTPNLSEATKANYAGKLCMYHAISGVCDGGGTTDPARYIARMKPLRVLFKVPYDDDIWGPVMAYLFGFAHFATYETRGEFDDGMENAPEGRYYISIMQKNVGSGASGHAIYAVRGSGNAAMTFHDNEAPNLTNRIRDKFDNTVRYVVFKRTGLVPDSEKKLLDRLETIPDRLKRFLIRAHNVYVGYKIAGVDADEIDIGTVDEKLGKMVVGIRGEKGYDHEYANNFYGLLQDEVRNYWS